MTFNQKHKSVKKCTTCFMACAGLFRWLKLWKQTCIEGSRSRELGFKTLFCKKHRRSANYKPNQLRTLRWLNFLGEKCRSHHFSLKSIMDHYITNNLINSVHQTPFFLVLNEHNCSFRKVCLASFNPYLKILCIKIENKNYQ